MEDDKRDLTNQFEAAKREAENTKRNLEREHQRIIEQFNVSICLCYIQVFVL